MTTGFPMADAKFVAFVIMGPPEGATDRRRCGENLNAERRFETAHGREGPDVHINRNAKLCGISQGPRKLV
jgi:hypothetical protein